jgi:3-hydroxybutyryl-CoA dehydrogenase
MDNYKVAVIGSGLMGAGIAQTVASAGYEVFNIDISKESLRKAETNINKIFDKKIAKGKISVEDKNAVLNKITYIDDFTVLNEVKIIIEAVPENIKIKKDTFINIQDYCKDCYIISNTSGLSISEMASVTKRPENFIGAHFFYPAPVMKLVELIKGLSTSDETYEFVKDFIVSLNKTTVDAIELPGFIVNRILVPMMNEAAFLVMEGCKPEDVDTAMKLGANHPMGPLELCDFVGIDVMLATMNGLYAGFKDSKYRPCPILENMVKSGNLGRKTGKGFYNYR